PGSVLFVWVHANLSMLHSTWLGQVDATAESVRGGRAFCFPGQRRHHLHNRHYRSHANVRAGPLQRICGLSCRARLCFRFYLDRATPRLSSALIEFQARTTTAKRWPLLLWYDNVLNYPLDVI